MHASSTYLATAEQVNLKHSVVSAVLGGLAVLILTVIVNYALNPHIEIRKERLAEIARCRRETADLCAQAAAEVAGYLCSAPQGLSDPDTQYRSLAGGIERNINSLTAFGVDTKFEERTALPILRTSITSELVAANPSERGLFAQILYITATRLMTPRLHWLRRHTLAKKIEHASNAWLSWRADNVIMAQPEGTPGGSDASEDPPD